MGGVTRPERDVGLHGSDRQPGGTLSPARLGYDESLSETGEMVFRRNRHDPLADIDETTPHRFTIAVPEPGDLAQASAALATLSDEVTLRLVDGEIVVESTRSPRSAAVLRVLNVLRRSGVTVTGIDLLDVVEVSDHRALTNAIAAWERDANRGPARRRAESLGGAATLDALHRIVAAQDNDASGAARFVFGCAAFNTPGSEHGIMALAARDKKRSVELVGCALDRNWVDWLTGTQSSFEVGDLLAILRAGGYAAERALGLVGALPAPLEPQVRDELIRLADQNDHLARGAVVLLGRAEPDAALRSLLDRLMIDAPTNVRASALTAASQLWGSDLRPVWHAWLADRSAPLREAAEEMLGAHGGADDLDIATPHLVKLIRRRPGQVSWHIPREAPLIELLLRHRDRPQVEAAFDDLYARWNRLNPDIHDWLQREHPELVPNDVGVPTVADDHDAAEDKRPDRTEDGLVVEDVVWPLPSIDIHEGVATLRFDDTDMFETKDRFEQLCATHDAISILEEDREVLYLDIDDPEPVATITQLWAQAGGHPQP